MTTRMVMPLIIASLLFIGCEKEKKRITAEAAKQTDQRSTEPVESKRAQQKAPRNPKTDSTTGKPLAEQKQAEQTAEGSSDEGGTHSRKQAESVTPLDQSGSESDVAITRRIRQALLREDLSFVAKNVLVITEADHVVLKGPVRTASEAERIKGIAAAMTRKRIEDALEVTP